MPEKRMKRKWIVYDSDSGSDSDSDSDTRKKAVVNESDEKLVIPKYPKPEESEDVYYIDSAFCTSWNDNEVFVFIGYHYVVINHDPASPREDRVVKGPYLLCDGFPTFYGTAFQEFGVTAAFGCGFCDAFIFSGLSCAFLRYTSITWTGNIVEGPKHIKKMFPCLVGIKFDAMPVDAALEHRVTGDGEAYLFQGSKYALINYSKRTLISTGLITEAFPCLLNTMFASGIGAAFASHSCKQAYLFKDNSYVVIQFTLPGEAANANAYANSNGSYIIRGPEEIVPANWPSLRGLIPYKTNGRKTMEPTTWRPLWYRNRYVRIPLI